MIRRPPRSTQSRSSAASDVYKRQEDHFTRTIEDFHADLQWLYDHEFYVIPMADLVRDNISAPAGKHPVVLTFDDASPSQFRLIEQPDGNLLVCLLYTSP